MTNFDGDLDDAGSCLVEAILEKARSYPDEYNQLPGVDPIDVPMYNGNDDEYMWDEASHSTMKTSIERIVAERLEPWRKMPSPEAMAEPVKSIDAVMVAMAGGVGSGDVYNSSGRDPSAFDLDQTESLVYGTGAWSNDITKYMSRVNLNVSGWRGETITAFKETYVRRFSPMYKLQFNAVSILKLFLELEQDLWHGVRKDVIGVLNAAADSYTYLSSWGSAGSRNLLFNFYTVLAGVWGAIALGPAGAIASVVVGGVVGQMKDDAPQPPPPPELDGDTLLELWDGLGSALKELRNQVLDVESEIAAAISGVFDMYHEPAVVDRDGGESVVIPADKLVKMPPPNQLTNESVDSDGDGFVSRDELVDGVERPEEGYHRPAGETA